ncbi:hypothetical protein [Sandaracinus amylolyticus]|uniref:hypothetical protein n=1 Tax=Sandaracinus amylolyticus TaxID=927083 RepID=UPI001F2AC5A8|nr:hypothetical protein [Sandaracinus amylolyticus]UJR81864.1 Hypothetical protein I5071_39290 [Sandaracinus amylolyticus]
MSNHAERLRDFDAPADIAAWAAKHPSFDDAWDASPSSRHRVWLGAVSGVAVETIAESAAAAFFAVVESAPETEAFEQAVEESVAASDAETAAKLAERCERDAHALGSYRERDRTREAVIARAAGHVCRAFEALRAAESSMESDRLLRARTTASYMGGGVHAFLPAHPGPATLLVTAPASVERGLLVDAVTSAGEAVALLATLVLDTTSLDDAVWDALATS